MTDSSPSRSAPTVPSLVAPQGASTVYGREVTFVWESVEAADSYRLQVAPTARFDDLVLDEDVGAETAVTVGNTFPTDGDTFFWRVRAVNDQGWSEGGPVESFVAATAEDAEQEPVPGEGEEAPVTSLARAEQEEVPRQVFEMGARFEREKERGVAYEGVASSQIMSVAVAILLVVMGAVVVIFNWYGQVVQETEAAASDPANYERLQRADRQAAQRLTEYGVVDEDEGVYHIPITDAMELVEEEYQGTDGEP